MIEVVGDLWTYPADARVITTNGFVKKNGEAVMGRGTAAQAVKRWPAIAITLGVCLQYHPSGNVPYMLASPPLTDVDLWSFPVKHNFWEKADLVLIEKSARFFLMVAENMGYQTIVMPRPGCGNGQLTWEEVKPVIEPILDDRFHIIERPENA